METKIKLGVIYALLHLNTSVKYYNQTSVQIIFN